MRLALPLLSVLTPSALVALVARFEAARAKAPPPPARPARPTLPLRVHVALQAAARARR